jgi:hypothetical protein
MGAAALPRRVLRSEGFSEAGPASPSPGQDQHRGHGYHGEGRKGLALRALPWVGRLLGVVGSWVAVVLPGQRLLQRPLGTLVVGLRALAPPAARTLSATSATTVRMRAAVFIGDLLCVGEAGRCRPGGVRRRLPYRWRMRTA